MNLITGLTDQPNQQTTIVLSGGTKVVLYMEYRSQQSGWFYNISWNGTDIVLGQRMVAAPNLLRQYLNKIPFGLALITGGNVEPLNIEDFSDGVAALYLLEGSDLTAIESQVYGAPPVAEEPTITTPAGTAVIIPPSSWGPASGDLGGSYPAPIVRALHETSASQQLTIDSIPDGKYLKRVGTLIQGMDVPGSDPWFNVKSFGAVGNGSNDDTTAIHNAIAAAVAAGGTVFFPSGKYKTSAVLNATTTSGKNVSFIGNSMADTFIYQTAVGSNGLTIDNSAGVQCYTEVTGISFITAPNVACGTALTITYGNTNIASTSHFPGPWVHHCSFGQKLSNDTGGWVNGITAINCWLAKFETLFSLGSFYTYSSASSPGAGDGGPGSGYFIGCFSGVNYTISDIHGHAWGQGIRLAPVSASTVGQNQIAQGVIMSEINFVECWEGFHAYTNALEDVYDFLSLVNFQFDLGNYSLATHRCIYIQGGSIILIDNGLCLQNNGSPIIELNNVTASIMRGVEMQATINNPSAALALSSTSNNNIITSCDFNGLPVTLGALAGENRIDSTYTASAVTNSGINNRIGDPRQFAVVITPTATATYTFSTSIADCGLSGKPLAAPAAIIDGIALPNDYECRYAQANAGNNATTAFFTLYRTGGGNLAASPLRIGISISP